ncbi:Vascular endothelial growth factor receptor kdr-like [Orchesella cincta]|uniref:Vascular endothelial growth factor receptor kdr-like n=1 Tax=Orchesella cincta TaxID=48709 RepID=A0A1D2N0Z0_ORCCI|nr:Vascular endothelial growth factor receptor kdr-like [Orchesella cincta]
MNELGNFTELSKDIMQKYDPKMGFLLRAGSEPNVLAGKYVCSGSYKNDTEVVEVTVSPPKGFIVSPSKNHLTFRNSKISMQCKATEPVEMKFTNQNVPVQHHVREITYKSDTFKYGAAADIFTHPKQDQIRGDVSCVKKSNQEALWTWHYDTDYGCNCNWTLKNDGIKAARFYFLLDRTFRGTIRAYALNTEGDGYFLNIPTPRGELSCTSKASARVNMTFIPCENPVECQIKSGFLSWFDFDARSYSAESIFSDEDGEDNHNVTTISQGYIRSGIVKCGVGDYITTKFAIANLDTLYIDSVPTANLVRIVGPETNVFVGDKMLFTCMYEKFQIAREAQWAFMYKNGTIDFFDVEKKDDRFSYDLEKYLRSSFIKIPSSEITGLMCFAPVWNSTQWKNSTFALNVSPTPPVDAESPLNCPVDSNPIIILQRNSSISSRRLRVPHLVSNQTLSLYNPVDEIKLICRANYPVQWFRGTEKTNSSKIGKVPCNNVLSMKKVYEAVLHIDPLQKESTGNYTCRKTFAKYPQASAYIYAVGDGEATFVNEGRHMQVIKNVRDYDTWVTLPCEVSNPQSKPYLFLDHEDSERIHRLELGSNLRYDPKMGFEIDSSTVSDPVTTFVCSMSENATTFGVLITLHKQEGELIAGAIGSQQPPSGGMLLAFTIFLLALVILLAVGLFVMYRKCQEASTKPPDGHQMGTRDTFSSYDDVRIQHDDRENIVDGNYNRFS